MRTWLYRFAGPLLVVLPLTWIYRAAYPEQLDTVRMTVALVLISFAASEAGGDIQRRRDERSSPVAGSPK